MAKKDVRARLSWDGVKKFVADIRGAGEQIDKSFDKGKRNVKEFEREGKKAAKSLKSGFGSMAKSLGLALGAGVAIAGLKRLITNTIQARDEIAKFAKATDVSVKFLSGIGFAAEQSGADFQAFQTGMRGLFRRMQDVKDGSIEGMRVFEQLGVTVVDGAGKLRSAETVFLEVADAISQHGNKTEAAALAQELFGRSGLKLIPMLQQGRDGIKKLTVEAERLGVVFDERAAKEAEEAADSLNRFSTAMTGLGQRLATSVLPTLSDAADALSEIITLMQGVRNLEDIADEARQKAKGEVENARAEALNKEIAALEFLQGKLEGRIELQKISNERLQEFEATLSGLRGDGLQLDTLRQVNMQLKIAKELRGDIDVVTEAEAEKQQAAQEKAIRQAKKRKEKEELVAEQLKLQRLILEGQKAARGELTKAAEEVFREFDAEAPAAIAVKEREILGIKKQQKLEYVDINAIIDSNKEKLEKLEKEELVAIEERLRKIALFWGDVGAQIANAVFEGQRFVKTLEQIAKQLAKRVFAGLIGGALGFVFSGGNPAAAVAGFKAASGFSFQHGTPPGGIKIPPGFRNDSFPILVSSGETVRVTPAGEPPNSEQQIVVQGPLLNVNVRQLDLETLEFEVIPRMRRILIERFGVARI